MREIKFRAWGKNKMFYADSKQFGFQLNGGGQWSYCDYACECVYVTSGSGKLMQFTGLKDKNGREIYEGDVVEYDKDFINKPFHGNIFRYEIGFFQGNFILIDPEEKTEPRGGFSGIYLHALGFKVIGNIYKNPDLLKSTD